MASAASVRMASISRANTTSVARRRCRIETPDIARNEDGEFAGDCRVPRAVNALLAIRYDAEFTHGLQPLDERHEISLARRFWPFTQPSKRRAVFIVGDDEQSFQPGDRLRR